MEAIGNKGELDASKSKELREVLNGYTYVADGDVMLAKITPCFENGKAAIAAGLTSGVGFATTEVIPARPYRPQDAKYLYYLFTSMPFKAIAERSMYGAGGQKRVADSFVAEYHYSEPPESERDTIAAFLDYETARIDTLIAKQQRLIELLKEKRQAVISHAVTKGLNPDAPMKDSGVEWLGQVPEHWMASKIRYAAKLESGHTPSRNKPDYWVDCHIPWISLSDVWQLRSGNQIYIHEKEKVSELGLANSSARLLPKGTVILSRTASVGFPGVMARDMATTQDFANWICGAKLIPEFLYFVLLGMKHEFKRLMMGSTHKTIYMPEIQGLSTPLPSRDEQQLIVEYLERKLPKFDELLNKAAQAVDLHIERRTALISAAVTGKIDVRNWSPTRQPVEPELLMAAESRAEYQVS
jgi:type I restriction enzyme S subunit